MIFNNPIQCKIGKLGIMVNALTASQLSLATIGAINRLLAKRSDVSPTLFFEMATPTCLPLPCAAMSSPEIWGFSGPIIATSLSTADKLRHPISPKQKFFYVWDLEWLRYQPDFWRLRDIYASMPIIARSKDHAKAIEDAWNVSVVYIGDMEDVFNYVLGDK